MTLRIDVIRLSGDAGFGPIFINEHLDMLTRVVDLAKADALAEIMPPMIIDAKSLDPEILRGMLERAAPMPIVAMPPSDEVAAAVAAEREACLKLCKDAQKASAETRAQCKGGEGLMGAASELVAAGAEKQAEKLADAISARGTP